MIYYMMILKVVVRLKQKVLEVKSHGTHNEVVHHMVRHIVVHPVDLKVQLVLLRSTSMLSVFQLYQGKMDNKVVFQVKMELRILIWTTSCAMVSFTKRNSLVVLLRNHTTTI